MGKFIRICPQIVLAALALTLVLPRPVAVKASAQDAQQQTIEVTAKRYEFDPATIHVKQGAKVQLKFTAIDHDHGFKIREYPDGADMKGQPGIVITSYQECVKLVKGTATIVEFAAQTPGTYSFRCCNFCGMGHSGMKGQIVVDPSGAN